MYDVIRKDEYFSWLTNGFYCDQRPRLKSAQDALVMSLLKGQKGLKIAEVGGGDSRVLKILSKHNDCWNIDKLEGIGGGPTFVKKIAGVKMVDVFLGEFSDKLPSDYFDCVFSVSVVEHVLEEDLVNFFRDIERILKPGGMTVHAVDIYMDDNTLNDHVWKKFINIVDGNCPSLSLIEEIRLVSDLKYSTSMVTDPDINMWQRNNLVPNLAEMRANSQCVSLKMGWHKEDRIKANKADKEILIYQMGKVGSSTIKRTLKEEGFHVNHFHYVKGDYAGTGDRDLIKDNNHDSIAKYQGKIITLVRDPIARNLSAFFQNLGVFGISIDRKVDVDKLVSVFFEKYNSRIPLDWFDIELKVSTGIDVYEYDFNKTVGHSVILSNKKELLILKCESDDFVKSQALKLFLGLDHDLNLKYSNVGSTKEYSSIYVEFLNRISFTGKYIEVMYSSRYVKHFYTKTEIDTFKSRWTT